MSIPEELTDNPAHMEVKDFICHGCGVQRVKVKTELAGVMLGQRPGEYIRLKTGPLWAQNNCRETGNCLAEQLEPIVAPYADKRVCICALGNPAYAIDALGPTVAQKFPAMFLEKADQIGECRFSKLTTLLPLVQDVTNINTPELLHGMVSAAQADFLVVIDSATAGDLKELCGAINISTSSGPALYGGRASVDWSGMGIPMIHIGVPTIFNAQSAVEGGLPLTVFTIQSVIETAACIIAYALVRLSYPTLSEQDCIDVVQLRQLPCVWG